MRPSPVLSSPFSRRRALVLAGGGALAVAGTSARRLAADAPTVDLPPEQVAEYAGRYADLGQAFTFAQTDKGLELTIELTEQPGAWLPAIFPPLPPPAPVAFLAADVAVANRQRLPFVRDPDGRVGWVATGLRLLPRVEAGA